MVFLHCPKKDDFTNHCLYCLFKLGEHPGCGHILVSMHVQLLAVPTVPPGHRRGLLEVEEDQVDATAVPWRRWVPHWASPCAHGIPRCEAGECGWKGPLHQPPSARCQQFSTRNLFFLHVFWPLKNTVCFWFGSLATASLRGSSCVLCFFFSFDLPYSTWYDMYI